MDNINHTGNTGTEAVHGGPDYAILRKEGIDPEDILDFSVCLNPFPLPRQVRKAVMRADLRRYPDARAGALVSALAEFHQKEEDEIVVVNGLSQGIFLLATGLLGSGKTAIVINPAYGEYEKCSRAAGTKVVSFQTAERDDFHPDIAALRGLILDRKPAVVWMCNPNNPTGALVGRDDMQSVSNACAETGGVLVVDEAYMNFVPRNERYCFSDSGAVILRSMTKDFTLPGLRLGYMIGSKHIISMVRNLQPQWSLNSAALEAGAASLEQYDHFERQWLRIREHREELAAGLEALAFKVFPSAANFLLMKDEQRGGIDAGHFREILWKSKILVRDCTSFGLPGFLRIGVSTRRNNRRLLKELSGSELWER